MSAKDNYQLEYNTQVLLKDGSSIQLRPARQDDTEACLSLFRRAGDRNEFLHSRHSNEHANRSIQRFCKVDYINTLTLIAEVLRDGKKDVVGIGRYYRRPKWSG